MEKEYILWVLGSIQTIVTGIVVYVFKSLIDDRLRIGRLEIILATISEKAASILHSPHTPELDALLEKYVNRNYELTPEEWQRLLAMTDDIERDHGVSKGERVLAAILHAVAAHKLFLPPPEIHKHEEIEVDKPAESN